MKRIILMFIANFIRLPYMYYKVMRMSRHPEKYSHAQCYALLHWLVKWANKGGRVTVVSSGVDKLPKENGYIMYANHQGLYDTLSILQETDRPFSPVSKIEVKDVFLLKIVLRMLRSEYMDRSDIRQSLTVINNIAARIKTGDNFIIFPEGTRSKLGNKMLPFKPGAFKAATLSKCPIVPIAMVDCFIPFDIPSIRKVTVQMHVLDPIPYEEYKDMKTTEIALMVQHRIEEAISKAPQL